MSSLDKALSIIACFSPERPALSVSESAAELQMPKSSVSRLMKTMAEAGLLEAQAGRRGYAPGPLAFRLGNLYQSRLRIIDLADAAVTEIVAYYGLTGYVGVLSGADVVLLSVHQGRFPIRLVLDRGARVPAHVSAIGQALLSRRSDDEIEALYPKPIRYAETGITHMPSDILARAQDVHSLGHAAVEGVTFRGFNAVGVAVDSAKEQLCVGFSLSYPQEMLARFDLGEIIGAITASAAEIGEKTGDPYWIAGRPRTSTAECKRGRPPSSGPTLTNNARRAKASRKTIPNEPTRRT